MSQIIQLGFQGREVEFTSEGWFSATTAAAGFGKSPSEWLRLPETARYIEGLERKYGKIPYLKTSRGRGGGTWLHPKLAVRFARWLDVDFEIWCDEQIDSIVRGASAKAAARSAAASSNKVMRRMLEAARAAEGKETKPHHYINECRLVNWSVGAGFEALNRDQMTPEQLDALSNAEIQNAVMIGSRLPYGERKGLLEQQRIAVTPSHPLPRKLPKRRAPKAA